MVRLDWQDKQAYLILSLSWYCSSKYCKKCPQIYEGFKNILFHYLLIVNIPSVMCIETFSFLLSFRIHRTLQNGIEQFHNYKILQDVTMMYIILHFLWQAALKISYLHFLHPVLCCRSLFLCIINKSIVVKQSTTCISSFLWS